MKYKCDDCGEVCEEWQLDKEYFDYGVGTPSGWNYACPHCGSLDVREYNEEDEESEE